MPPDTERTAPMGVVRDQQIDALAFARQVLRFEPDEKQKQVLLSPARRGILNCARQWGKSTIAAVMAIHRVWTAPGKLVLVASPTERQTREFVRKAKTMLRRAGIRPRGDGDNPVSIALPNGSRIVGLPGSEHTVRGFSSVSLLLIDEAAQVTDGLYRSLRPMLANGSGDLWLMSTPWGKRGFFYESWAHGGDRWTRVSVPATECPRISPEFLDEERAAHGETHLRQEYLCEFVGNRLSVFDADLLERALDGDIDGLVVDMLRRAQLGCEISAVTITGGGQETRHGARKSVPKQDLIGGLQALVEQEYLRIAKSLKHARLLLRELADMKATRSESGHVRIGADGNAEHDDIVIALALACWRAARRENGFGPALLPAYN